MCPTVGVLVVAGAIAAAAVAQTVITIIVIMIIEVKKTGETAVVVVAPVTIVTLIAVGLAIVIGVDLIATQMIRAHALDLGHDMVRPFKLVKLGIKILTL